ncbi:App1 family protein [Bernardetia sp. ABR2-2B]|uniref:App1 family protein n=1 Tax=Bernardetia sp. ABR2-2B TaxID=3127472 RepID=UPI0030D09329
MRSDSNLHLKSDLKVYRGYVSDKLLVVFGHVFKKKATTLSEKSRFKHAYSILRTFQRKTISDADVFLHFNNKKIHTKTLSDGYFRFSIPLETSFQDNTQSGWNKIEVELNHEGKSVKKATEILRPYDGKLAIISDIDDTFLVSHTNNLFKKIYVLLWRNVNDRKIFEDVTAHYQQLSKAGQEKGETNAFFYVSSSEWNLYNFIEKFTKIHNLPKAVIKLKTIKTSLLDFLFTGRGNHDHKFQKIKEIIEFYPHLEFVLLGDDSQADPIIYEKTCKVFPQNIKAIYIRQTKKQQKSSTKKILQNIESLGKKTCYFLKSEEAILHSKEIGIV